MGEGTDHLLLIELQKRGDVASFVEAKGKALSDATPILSLSTPQSPLRELKRENWRRGVIKAGIAGTGAPISPTPSDFSFICVDATEGVLGTAGWI